MLKNVDVCDVDEHCGYWEMNMDWIRRWRVTSNWLKWKQRRAINRIGQLQDDWPTWLMADVMSTSGRVKWSWSAHWDGGSLKEETTLKKLLRMRMMSGFTSTLFFSYWVKHIVTSVHTWCHRSSLHMSPFIITRHRCTPPPPQAPHPPRACLHSVCLSDSWLCSVWPRFELEWSPDRL